ncbi:hypothetical protein [Devosia sp. 2618]|uniref:hypothetical protein n=1 Tax=Devosia sp. 2618 TaxID=3156454 RepID=UPI003399977B
MSNALGISPSVMINRLVDRTGTGLDAQLAKVAQLRLELEVAGNAEQVKEAGLSPTGEAEAPVINTGAVVDRLI